MKVFLDLNGPRVSMDDFMSRLHSASLISRISHLKQPVRGAIAPPHSAPRVTGEMVNTLVMEGFEAYCSILFTYPVGSPNKAAVTERRLENGFFPRLAFTVVDELGHAIDLCKISAFVERRTRIAEVNFAVLALTAANVLVSDSMFVVKSGEDTELRFEGELLAHVSSHEKARWNPAVDGSRMSLSVYRTGAGTFVCERVKSVDDKTERYSAAVCQSHDEIVEFFSDGKLALLLYASVGVVHGN